MSIHKFAISLFIAFAASLPGISWAHWAVDADPDTGVAYALTNASTATGAEKEAKAACAKLAIKFGSKNKGASCVLLRSGSRTGIIVLAASDISIGFSIDDDVEVAERAAIEHCMRGRPADTVCKVANRREETLGAKETTRVVSQTISRDVVHCTNQCYNGSCTRTFDDGRKEKWQAPRKFDPFTSNWGWDTTTNACGI